MRKTTKITITQEGRDKNKVFVLTELPADQAERWALRALLGMLQSGADISIEQLHGGMAAVAALGLQSLGGIRWEVLEPLLDEMWECIAYEHKPGQPVQSIVPGLNSQIEEVQTRFALQLAVLELHMGFFVAGATPTSDPQAEENGASSASTFLASLSSWYRRMLRR